MYMIDTIKKPYIDTFKILFKPDLRLNLYLLKNILAFQFGIINEN